MAPKSKKTRPSGKRTIVFFHPDLGIGGAERLVVDAAIGLQNRGHRVVIFTSHCDPTHCFDEVKPKDHGGLGLLDVRVRGGSVVPPSVGGRLAILCAIARQVLLLYEISASGELRDLQPTGYFVDQLSAGVPLLGWLSSSSPAEANAPRVPTLFYCHFPDLLLASRPNIIKRLYRIPFDALEQWSMGFADAVAVNSKFTRGVVTKTWPRLAAHTDLRVVYPCIDVSGQTSDAGSSPADSPATPTLLSINRFERKKNIDLAIRAFAGLPIALRHSSRLVVAGGYDARVAENVAYHHELNDLAISLGLETETRKGDALIKEAPSRAQVLFLLSVPSAVKSLLLASACLLVYTPANEHFGIVPLEAMLAGCPVLACDSGGPTETVVEGETGWLRPGDDIAAWTRVMEQVLGGTGGPPGGPGDALSAAQKAKMSAAGRKRVLEQFADVQMAARIDGIYDELEAQVVSGVPAPTSFPSLPVLGMLLVALLAVFIAVVVQLLKGRE